MSAPDDHYNELFDEFEAFKKTSNDMEEILNNSLNAANDEVRRLKRQLGEAQNDKEEYRERLANIMSSEEDLRQEISDLKNTISELKAEKIQYYNKVELLENLNRKNEFTIKKLTSSNEILEEKLIINSEEMSEIRAQLLKTQKDCIHAQENIERLLNQSMASKQHSTPYGGAATRTVAAEIPDITNDASDKRQQDTSSLRPYRPNNSNTQASKMGLSEAAHSNGNTTDDVCVATDYRSLSNVACYNSDKALDAMVVRLRRIAAKCRQASAT
eukprot:Tbor_TRINITY_DN8474_c0_g1::TRINITY_DN8474_c0_g1_i1::g.5287::m.5287